MRILLASALAAIALFIRKEVFTLAINSAWGPGVSTRWAGHFICAIRTLLILLTLATAAYPQAPPDYIQASISPPASIASPVPQPAKIVEMNDEDPEYEPSSIVITAGQTVEWHNNGQVSHSVVDDAKRAAKPDDALIPTGVPAFNSGNVMPGGIYKHTFTMPGHYRYFCMSHELDGMVGEVIVRPAEPGEEIEISQAKSERSTSERGKHEMSLQELANAAQSIISSPPQMDKRGSGSMRIVQMNDGEPTYQPSSIVIRAGQTVEWQNNGHVSHSVTDDARRAAKPDDALMPRGVESFNSGNIMPGGTYKHTFTVPGRYRYFCMSHEIDEMVGEITVLPGPPGTERLISQVRSEPRTNLEHGSDPLVRDPITRSLTAK
jgi:plastocyanin